MTNPPGRPLTHGGPQRKRAIFLDDSRAAWIAETHGRGKLSEGVRALIDAARLSPDDNNPTHQEKEMNTFATPCRSPFGDLFDRLQDAAAQSEIDDIVNEARARASRVDPISLEYLAEADLAEQDGDEAFANFLRDANNRWYQVE